MASMGESSTPAVSTDALTKRFGTFSAVDGVTLQVEQGEVFGFLGPNGAGKTTTIRMLLGLARPSAGHARIFGLDSWAQAGAAHRHVAFVPGEMEVWPNLRGGEVLDLLGSVHGGYDSRLRDELCDRFEFDPTKRGHEYSKGNRQKIGLIAALMVRPDLLVLDEPTGGLDPLMEVEFRGCVAEARQRGQTVFLSSHVLSEVEAVCDRVGILRKGRLVETGTLDDLRRLDRREVVVELGDGAAPDLSGVAGVEEVTVEGPRLRCRLRGEPTDLIRALAPYRVHSLDIREPSLEEVFLGYYGDGAGDDEV